MIASASWGIETNNSSLWNWRLSGWKSKRKPLVEQLRIHDLETPQGGRPQLNSLVEFPPESVLQPLVAVRWLQAGIRNYFRALADETQVLVAKLRNPDLVSNPSRLWEVDLLRGVAIALMVLIHIIPPTTSMLFVLIPLIAMRLLFFGAVAAALAWFGLSLPSTEGANEATSFQKWSKRGLNALALLTAFFFIHGTQSLTLVEMFAGIMGISLILGHEQKIRRTGQARTFSEQLSRTLPLMIEGSILTLAFSVFGHNIGYVPSLFAMLGLSQLLAYPFLSRTRWLSFSVGLAAIGLVTVPLFAMLTPHLPAILIGYPLGTARTSFLPWFGATLLGVFIGKTLYKQGERRFTLPDVSQTAPCRQLVVIGQHARLVFLMHLPLTLGWILYGQDIYAAALAASPRPYPFKFVLL